MTYLFLIPLLLLFGVLWWELNQHDTSKYIRKLDEPQEDIEQRIARNTWIKSLVMSAASRSAK